MRIYTIGVYGTDEDSFFRALKMRNVGIFVDIRARRGMRGPRYKYVNSTYLQRCLQRMGIPYAHLRHLAPTPEMRQVQQAVDKATHTLKSERTHLCAQYSKAYTQLLEDMEYNLTKLENQARQVARVPADRRINSLVLFCVEREPNACHRSLVSTYMEKYGAVVSHIRA